VADTIYEILERNTKMNNIWILAQVETPASSGITSEPVDTQQESVTTVPSDPNAPAPAPQRRAPGMQQFIFIALLILVMYFLIFRGPKKKQQQQQKMVRNLKKNDRVRTIGGILGTVVDIKENEITLKIDESNNTKIKIVASAIGANISQQKD